MDNIYFFIKNKFPLSEYEEDFIFDNLQKIIFVLYDFETYKFQFRFLKKHFKINPIIISFEDYKKIKECYLFYNDITNYVEKMLIFQFKNSLIINKDVYLSNCFNFITNEKLISNFNIIKPSLIKKIKKKYINKNRFQHALNVGFISFKISYFQSKKKDAESIFLAGLFHDITKDFPQKKLLVLAKKNKYYIESKNYVLHQFASAEYYKKIFTNFNEYIYSSISFHCTGKKNMNLFEKVLFFSDKIDPLRYLNNESRIIKITNILRDSYFNFDNSFNEMVLDLVNYFTSQNYDFNENLYSKEFVNFYYKK